MILKYFSIIIFLNAFVASNGLLTQLLNYFNFELGEISYQHPDAKLSVPELIQKNGYPVEIHTIQTEDNYFLTIHRIPFVGKQNKTKKKRKPILLMHGILESSYDWIRMGPQRSLGYLLADLGYDVWIGNARGTKHSRRHAVLDPDKDADRFWDFSWHEIGVYDLPAIIDYILGNTSSKKIHYIGHSQGCTAFFVMTSMRPKYNQKIVNMIALAPAVFMKNVKSPLLQYSAKYLPVATLILQVVARYEFLPSRGFMKNVEMWCNKDILTLQICENILYLTTGYDKAQMDTEKLPVIFTNSSAGCSTKQLIHFLQNTRSKNNSFSLFDYGIKKNKGIYNSFYPPEYPLRRVITPIALFSSYNDIFADVKDIDKLGSILPNVSLNYRVPFKGFTHLDFLWAKDVVSLVYNEIFKQLNLFK